MLKNIIALAIAVFTVVPAVWADDEKTPDWIKDTSGIGKSNDGVVRSDQILELGVPTSSAMQLEGENLLRMGNLDHALVALQKSVEMAPLDMDKRTLYSEALEKKLIKQKLKDPALYNYVIKQWLFIFRQAEFIDQSMNAKAHIVHLTGTAPKAFEKSEKFLMRVMIPEDGSARVALTSRKDKSAPAAH